MADTIKVVSEISSIQGQSCEWQTESNQKMQVTKINKQNKKQVLYYMPNQGLNYDEKVFHPCSWSINDFQVGRHLGKGKYGHVYLVRQRRSKQILALKVLSKKQLQKNDIIFQLRRQIQIHSHLCHAHILKMYGFFYDQKKIYIILDYAPKGQLYKVLQQQARFQEQRAAKYIHQMIQAVSHLHSLKIIHRDIKPENILLSIDDHIKLTDFGWSIHVSHRQKKRRTYCGTPDYICPEIAFQKDYDYRLDLWCVGILAFQLVAGHPPFNDVKDRKQLITRIKQVKFEFPIHFSDQLKDFIASLLKSKAEERMSMQNASKHPWIQRFSIEAQTNKNQLNDIQI